jgi:hypothetical protein
MSSFARFRALPAPSARPALREPPAAVARRPLNDRIHNTTWLVARAFGFQAFNARDSDTSSSAGPSAPECVASTAFLAADHLETLLVRNIMPRLAEEEAGSSAGGAHRAGGQKGGDTVVLKEAERGGGDADMPPIKQPPHHHQQQEPQQEPQHQEAAFARAVWELHSHIFLSYEGAGGWCRQVGLAARLAAAEAEVLSSRHAAADREVVQLLLSELALYFLLYSEAANLRHTPELMWFLFWAAVHSPAMERLWREGLQPAQQLSNARQRRLVMRNSLQAQLREAQEHMGHQPAACSLERCATTAAQLASQLPDLLPSLGLPHTALTEAPTSSFPSCSSDLSLTCAASRELFADLACFGDGGFWTDVLVSPLFTVLAFEVDHMASSGQEVAHRLGYDDVNESMCHRDVVAKLLEALGVTLAAAEAGQVHGALDALTRLGYPPAVSHGVADNADGSGTGGGVSASGPGSSCSDPRLFDPVLAAAFWADSVFVKTHRERRSWVSLLRAFYRVYSLQLVLIHATMAIAFAPGSLRALSSAVVTHAVVAALERTANWWLTRGTRDPLRGVRARESWLTVPVEQLQRADVEAGRAAGEQEGSTGAAAESHSIGLASSGPRRTRLLSDGSAVEERAARRRRVVVEGSPVCGVFGWLEWAVVAAALLGLFTLQYMGPAPLQKMARSYWPLAAGGYISAVVVHGLITTRDGYSLSLSSVLRLPALFRASSQRATPSCWLHRPMAVGWRAALLTAVFWVQVLAAKVAFDYFVIMKPMAGQVSTQGHRECGRP